MDLTVEQRSALEQFPSSLRALVESELASGNAVAEIGHSFPAPPAGAYIKLAKKVTTRPRFSDATIDFYERNSSIYSGEFTDAQRFYFVLEPPNPPPPEPDMNAIRKAAIGDEDELVRLAQRPSGPSGFAAVVMQLKDQLFEKKKTVPPATLLPRTEGSSNVEERSTPSGRCWLLHFRDTCPPEAIQAEFEREVMTVMRPRIEEGKLAWRGQTKVVGALWSFILTFEAVIERINSYSLRLEVTWAGLPADSHAYYKKSSASWFLLWTRHFQGAPPPPAEKAPGEGYARLAEGALKAEAQIDSVDAIQQLIVAALKRGASFGTSHKEGGTNIQWEGGRFTRADYGESQDRQEFTDEASFLIFLRRFYSSEVSRGCYPEEPSEVDAWRLILRRLRTP